MPGSKCSVKISVGKRMNLAVLLPGLNVWLWSNSYSMKSQTFLTCHLCQGPGLPFLSCLCSQCSHFLKCFSFSLLVQIFLFFKHSASAVSSVKTFDPRVALSTLFSCAQCAICSSIYYLATWVTVIYIHGSSLLLGGKSLQEIPVFPKCLFWCFGARYLWSDGRSELYGYLGLYLWHWLRFRDRCKF